MIIYIIVIFVYLSFLLDFLVWPIPSEASTFSLINGNTKVNFIHKFFLLIVFIVNLFFYLTPLGLSIYYLQNGFEIPGTPLTILGIAMSITGRIISIKAAQVMRKKGDGLVGNSLFKYSRNPISLGLHITIIGLMIIFDKWYLWLGFIFYLINIHYKIKVEESHLQKKYGTLYDLYQAKTPRYLINTGWLHNRT